MRELPARIAERTGGNPFFAEEVVQSLIEDGSLEGERGAYRLARPLDQVPLPPTVQSVLAARIDRLPEREKRVLQAASVVGREFPGPLAGRLAGLAEPELAPALAALRRGEFLYEAELYPVARYAFKHPLTQEVYLPRPRQVARPRPPRAGGLSHITSHQGGGGRPCSALIPVRSLAVLHRKPRRVDSCTSARGLLGRTRGSGPWTGSPVLQLSSSTDCTAGRRVSAPSSWPGGPFEVDQHAVSASTLARSLVQPSVTAAQPWTW